MIAGRAAPARRIADTAAVLIVLGGVSALQALALRAGFPGASGDDFFHALLAYEWSERPYLATSAFGLSSIHWLPVHVWISGALYRLVGDLSIALTAISIAAMLVELYLFFLLTRRLWDRTVALIALMLVAFLPWHIWLGMSMTEMTLYFAATAGGFLGLARWLERDAAGDLISASAGFACAAMLRPEGWITAAVFCVWVLANAARQRVAVRPAVVAVLIPSVFVAVWMTYNLLEFGHPLHFLRSNQAHMSGYLAMGRVRYLVTVLQFPFLMFTISPLLFVLVGWGLLTVVRSLTGSQRTYVGLVLAHLAVLMLASLTGLGTKAAPQRFVLMTLILLAPLAAAALAQRWRSRHARYGVVALVALHIVTGSAKTLAYREDYEDTAAVGRYLKQRFESGAIGTSDQVATEVGFRMVAGWPLSTELAFLRDASDHAALEVFSGRPRNFVVNILHIAEADLIRAGAAPPAALGERVERLLAEHRVAAIVFKDRQLMAMIPASFGLETTIGRYAVFSRGARAGTAPLPPVRAAEGDLNWIVRNGLTLRRVTYHGGLLPHSIGLEWDYTSHAEEPMVTITFTHARDTQRQFTRVVRPIAQWLHPESPPARIRDEVPIAPPERMPSGDYIVTLSADGGAGSVQAPNVALVTSRRHALRDMVIGGRIDWRLLTRILLTA